ncbi:hypothetical protein WJX72_002658 [[Myrmecia] bisecta]|uniref:Archease domain-containing protein n=1 Tax=[Myrmecia] bisecta TaxID=41462 RepID=A0AAW1R587_9CHLO
MVDAPESCVAADIEQKASRAGKAGKYSQQAAAYRSEAEGSYNFEYLDHTADVQLHAWGVTLEEALASTALAMYNYMTPLEGLEPEAGEVRTFEAEGHDMDTLVYAFLDELLFTFCTELFVCSSLTVTSLDRENWKVTAQGRGHTFDRMHHASGTEIKAITYSAMQVREEPGDAEIFVIVDI